MGFRHVVLLQWADHVTPELVEHIREELQQLPAIIPEIKGYVHGSDVGVSEGNFDYCVVADFDDVRGWRTFRENPQHLVLIEELIKPNIKGRAAVQYQTPAARDPHAVASAQLQEFLSEIEGYG